MWQYHIVDRCDTRYKVFGEATCTECWQWRFWRNVLTQILTECSDAAFESDFRLTIRSDFESDIRWSNRPSSRYNMSVELFGDWPSPRKLIAKSNDDATSSILFIRTVFEELDGLVEYFGNRLGFRHGLNVRNGVMPARPCMHARACAHALKCLPMPLPLRSCSSKGLRHI